MKVLYYCLISFLLLNLQSCSKDDSSEGSGQNNTANASFGSVFFAQTHVRQPEDEGFKLISNRDALIKVNLEGDVGESSPNVKAILTLNGTSETLDLSGPSIVPESIDLSLGKTEHTFEDSFTAIIPKEYLQPGLKVSIEVGDESVSYDNLEIGAPNKMIMNMFDVSFFEATSGDYSTGWQEELQTKLPVSEIELKRLTDITFTELTVPPRSGANAIAARVSSQEEYETITGASFDGEQATAVQWNNALKKAAGVSGRYSLFFVNIYGVSSGGQAGGFAGVGNGTNLGILSHELGHALSLPHWGDNVDYPYKGDMHDISAPDSYNETHAGPIWGFDLEKNLFIAPTVQENSVGGTFGTYKQDPMQGGGTGDQEEGFLLRHFSDYSVNQIQDYLEGHIVVQNGGIGDYNAWDSTSQSYSSSVTNNGVQFAIESNIEVISVIAGVSAVTSQATILYPPVGPYESGIIDLFDPSNESDREKAASIYCPNGGCDVSLRIVQGGETRTVMLAIEMDYDADPLTADSFNTRAVNLKASEGEVTKIELLLTPNAEVDGLPNNPQVLYSWE